MPWSCCDRANKKDGHNELLRCDSREEVIVTTFLILNYYYSTLTHHSDPIALDSVHMTYLLHSQSAQLRTDL